MKDISIDLETLGIQPGRLILSIGAAMFDRWTGEIGDLFHAVINTHSSIEHGMTPDDGTMDWWQKQSEDARLTLRIASGLLPGAIDLPDALDFFTGFVTQDARVWGNGSDFDLGMLSAAYMRTGRKDPWSYRNARCLRTLRGEAGQLGLTVEKPKISGVRHNALDDAVYQAKWISNHLNAMRRRVPVFSQ